MTKSTLRNLILALVTFGIFGGMSVLGFFYILNDSQTLEEQILAVATQNQQEEALLRMQRTAQASETERNELASYFLLRESDIISFLSEIETIAPGLGLSLETADLEKVTVDGRDWIEVPFNVKGSRTDLHELIEILENIPYVSRVKSVSLSGSSDTNWQAIIVIQVQLLTYAE